MGEGSGAQNERRSGAGSAGVCLTVKTPPALGGPVRRTDGAASPGPRWVCPRQPAYTRRQGLAHPILKVVAVFQADLDGDWHLRQHGLRWRHRLALVVAVVALVPGRMDHAEEAAGGIARLVGPRVKEVLVGLAALRRAVAEFQVPQALDGDRGAVRLAEHAEVGARGRVKNVDIAVPATLPINRSLL